MLSELHVLRDLTDQAQSLANSHRILLEISAVFFKFLMFSANSSTAAGGRASHSPVL
jgi:hypothetical protein